MANIGILTFHRAINYGAVLQAVALQKKIESLGTNSELIDYIDEEFKLEYGLQKSFKTNNPVAKAILFLIKNSLFLVKKHKFNKFLDSYSVLSKCKYTEKNLASSESNYSTFVTGSDQVWNLKLTAGDKNYFLPFVPAEKKRSYAASFGFTTIPEGQEELYRDLLQDYKLASIREITGCRLFENLTGNSAVQTIDPTFLYNGKQWIDLCSLRKKEGKYILFYSVAKPAKLIKYVEEYAKKHNLKVIEVTSALKASSPSFSAARCAGPKDFLELILNAEFVATTSFHATVFSVLFHKDFCSELISGTGARNTRIDSILEMIGQENYLEKDMIELKNLDWNEVDARLGAKRSEAENYIKSIIN